MKYCIWVIGAFLLLAPTVVYAIDPFIAGQAAYQRARFQLIQQHHFDENAWRESSFFLENAVGFHPDHRAPGQGDGSYSNTPVAYRLLAETYAMLNYPRSMISAQINNAGNDPELNNDIAMLTKMRSEILAPPPPPSLETSSSGKNGPENRNDKIEQSHIKDAAPKMGESIPATKRPSRVQAKEIVENTINKEGTMVPTTAAFGDEPDNKITTTEVPRAEAQNTETTNADDELAKAAASNTVTVDGLQQAPSPVETRQDSVVLAEGRAKSNDPNASFIIIILRWLIALIGTGASIYLWFKQKNQKNRLPSKGAQSDFIGLKQARNYYPQD